MLNQNITNRVKCGNRIDNSLIVTPTDHQHSNTARYKVYSLTCLDDESMTCVDLGKYCDDAHDDWRACVQGASL